MTGDQACKWTMNYQSLIGYGTVEILENKNEKIAGLDILMSQFGSKKNSYHSKHVDAIVILKLTIESISGKQSK